MKLDIILDNPINVAISGELVEVEVLNITLPTVQYFNLYAGVKEIVVDAMFKMQDSITTDDNNNVEQDNDMENFPIDLYLSTGTIVRLSKAINKYLIQCAKFDDKIAINERTINKLSIKDYNNIIERLTYFLYQN